MRRPAEDSRWSPRRRRTGLIEPQVEALIKATGIDFRIGGGRAFYIPVHDYVQVRRRRPISNRSTGTGRRCMSSVTRPASRTGSLAICPALSARRSTPSKSWLPR